MDNKLKQNWIGVAFWAGLLGGTAYTSNALMDLFGSIISYIFQAVGGDIKVLFREFGLLFITVLGIGLLFLLILTWLELASLTFELSAQVFGKNGEEEEEDEESDMVSLPGKVTRYLAFTWGLFYIIFLILPLVSA